MEKIKYLHKRVFNLPLGIGDKVWTEHDSNHAWEVTQIDIYDNTIVFRLGNAGTDNYSAFHLHELGERYFLNQHEARTAEIKWCEEMETICRNSAT